MTFFAILIIIAAIVFLIVIKPSNKSHQDMSYDFRENQDDDNDKPSSYRKPRISAEVNDVFNSKVQSYCRNHSLTVSEFIRRAAKDYMDKNP